MPVFFFGLSQIHDPDWFSTAILFVVLHGMVYPSSNAYNSLMDRDEGSIGGLKAPPPVPAGIFKVTLILDILAVLIVYFIHAGASLLVLAYILASRAYSSRSVRLKKYPWAGFLIVAVFQGSIVFLITWSVANETGVLQAFLNPVVAFGMAVSFLLLGASYPLTQIYQHEQDLKDGVRSLSYVLGYKGTFVFSGIMFLLATITLFIMQWLYGDPWMMLAYIFITLPLLVIFISWFLKVSRNKAFADYKHTMQMNLTGAGCLNLFFLFLLIYPLI